MTFLIDYTVDTFQSSQALENRMKLLFKNDQAFSLPEGLGTYVAFLSEKKPTWVACQRQKRQKNLHINARLEKQ